jgi:hypothetical protein
MSSRRCLLCRVELFLAAGLYAWRGFGVRGRLFLADPVPAYATSSYAPRSGAPGGHGGGKERGVGETSGEPWGCGEVFPRGVPHTSRRLVRL